MSEAKPQFHFFLSSAGTWCSTGPDRTLTEAIKLMESEKLSFQIFYVPLPPGAEYKIAFYCPQVAGRGWSSSWSTRMADASSDPEVALVQEYGGYRAVRRLPDGSIAALGDLMFTRAIFLGCNHLGWERRFCFEDRQRADTEYAKLVSEDDEPTGWVARRPEAPCGRYGGR